ncbi:hypothetical protein [Salinibius halmophilus]|uniref:hypothetical protein n=1 Tax=Salinibius halmophilus TaxID=1853216 RepID=UPI0013140299|nr:hypothetical protein [Salinibius halmophilus]
MKNIRPRTTRRLRVVSRRYAPVILWLSLAALFIYAVVFGSFQSWYILFTVVLLAMFTPTLSDFITTDAKKNLYRDK